MTDILAMEFIPWKKKKKMTTLFRPIGQKELQLIIENGYTGFPPRLVWQPIFYPVMNVEYAREICQKWNIHDENSNFSGFVTAFDVDSDYLSQFEIQNVGGTQHNELWIPSEELSNFNAHIIGKIRVIEAYYGEKFVGEKLIN
jgi:hypothetical protein